MPHAIGCVPDRYCVAVMLDGCLRLASGHMFRPGSRRIDCWDIAPECGSQCLLGFFHYHVSAGIPTTFFHLCLLQLETWVLPCLAAALAPGIAVSAALLTLFTLHYCTTAGRHLRSWPHEWWEQDSL